LATGPVNCTDAPKTISFAIAEPDGIAQAAATNKRADKLDVFNMALSFAPRLCFSDWGNVLFLLFGFHRNKHAAGRVMQN
jgi:hypothetical protein